MIPSYKLRAELERCYEKQSRLQAKIKHLEAELVQAENLEIATAVKAVQMTPEELKAFLDAYTRGQLHISTVPADFEEVQTQIDETL